MKAYIVGLLGAAVGTGVTPALPDANNDFGPHLELRVGANGRPTGKWPSREVAAGPTIAFALSAAQATVKSCQGYHVGIAVLDAAGTPKLYYTPDGTASAHAYIAHLKAHTALRFGMASEDAAGRVTSDPAIAATWNADPQTYSVFAGGVPIMRSGKIIGAIGVSGAEPSAKDKACAEAGLRAAEADAAT